MIQNYSDPIVTLNQVYKASLVGTTQVLGACIIGPNYRIRDYLDFGENLRLDSDKIYPTSTYSNSFDFVHGLDARPFPEWLKDDKKYLDVKVFVKGAKLRYELFEASSDSLSLSLSGNITFVSNSISDQLSIMKDGALVKFRDPDTFEDLYTVGDLVRIELEDVNHVSFEQTYRIVSILQDNEGDYTKCVLSKNIKTLATDKVLKVSFFRERDCYVALSYIEKTEISPSNKKPLIKIRGNTRSELISLAEELSAVSYPIFGGAFYAEYKTFSTEFSARYGQVSSIDLVELMLGKISPENPLGIAVASAVRLAKGSFVYFVALDTDPEEASTDDQALVAAYNRAASIVAGTDGIYGIVPCTSNNNVLKALLAYVELQSAEQIPYFKYLYGSADAPEERLVLLKVPCSISTSDSITTITIPGSSLLSLTLMLEAGDKIGFGNGLLAEIETCDQKHTLTTKTAISDQVVKISLYKTLTKPSLIVDALIANKQIANKRCSIVFADGPMYQGAVRVPNYCTAAALAGLRSVSKPHAPLSNVVLTAITCKLPIGLTKALWDRLGAYGFWRVGMSLDGTCISKRQLTSAASGDVNYDEQSIITNIDSICLDLKTTGRAYVGNTNISGALLDILENLLLSKLDKYKKYTNSLIGPQLVSGRLISVSQDPVYKDRIYASLEGLPPKPFNKFHITFYMR